MDALLVEDGQKPLFFHDKNPEGAPPHVQNIVNFHLGNVNGVSLTFTGSAPAQRIFTNSFLQSIDFVYTAGAEASPDATRDGAVVGTAMGLVKSIEADFSSNLDYDHEAGLYNFLVYPNGTKFLHKTEGVTIPPGFWNSQGGDVVALTVLDLDDPTVPSQMCVVQMDLH